MTVQTLQAVVVGQHRGEEQDPAFAGTSAEQRPGERGCIEAGGSSREDLDSPLAQGEVARIPPGVQLWFERRAHQRNITRTSNDSQAKQTERM